MPAIRRWAALAAAVTTALVSLCATTAPAFAGNVPWTDPDAQGFVAFCDANGNNVTGGDINATPFVWKAVSSFAPKAAYQGVGENASLAIYQPRQDVLPANWSGGELTAASFYKDPKLPAVEATNQDYSLANFIAQFPPKLDGLYQVRMNFGKQNYGLVSTPYPATTIRVTGSTWQVVAGGELPCRSAVTVSQEILTGVAKSGLQDGTETVRSIPSPLHAAPVNPTAAESPSAAKTTKPATSAAGSRGATGARPGTSTSGASGARLAADSSSGGGASPVIWIAILTVLAAIAAIAIWTWRGRVRLSTRSGTEPNLHGR